jgi:hypothetical protein
MGAVIESSLGGAGLAGAGCAWVAARDRLHGSHHGPLGDRHALRVAADPDRFLAFRDLDFGDARLFEQFDQLLDLADIHA